MKMNVRLVKVLSIGSKKILQEQKRRFILWTFFSYEQIYEEFSKAFDAIKDTLGYIDLLSLHHPNVGPRGRREAWRQCKSLLNQVKLNQLVFHNGVKDMSMNCWSGIG